jgi:hypothetical protein
VSTTRGDASRSETDVSPQRQSEPAKVPYRLTAASAGSVIFWAAAATTVIWLMVLGRGLIFFYDEWDFVQSAGGPYLQNVLANHNGQTQMVPYTIYLLMLHTVGLHHYWPYRLVLALLDVLVGWLLYVATRTRIHPVVAASLAAILMLLGPAWQDLLWPFQIGFLGSVAGGLAAINLLARPGRWSGLAALAFLLISVGCSDVGVAFIVAVTVQLAWRRSTWRQLWIPLVPGALWAAWYLAKGRSGSPLHPSAVLHAIPTAAAAAAGSIIGLGPGPGGVLICAVGVAALVALVRSPKAGARLAMAMSGGVTFWGLTALARGSSDPNASRYLYPGAAFLLLVIAETWALLGASSVSRGLRPGLHASGRWQRRAQAAGLVAAVSLCAIVVWANATPLEAGSATLDSASASVGPELAAVQRAGTALPDSFRPDTTFMPQVVTGTYLRAVAQFGSPAPALGAGTADSNLESADLLLLRGRPIVLEPAAPVADCTPIALHTDGGVTAFTLPATGTALVTAPATSGITLRARAFAPHYTLPPIGLVSPGNTVSLRWDPQAAQGVHWRISLWPVVATSRPSSVADVRACRPIATPSPGASSRTR